MAMTPLYCRVVGSIECIREVPACPRIKAIDSPASVGGNAQELVQEKEKMGEIFNCILCQEIHWRCQKSQRSLGERFNTESAFEMALGCHSGRSTNVQIYFQLSFVLCSVFPNQ